MIQRYAGAESETRARLPQTLRLGLWAAAVPLCLVGASPLALDTPPYLSGLLLVAGVAVGLAIWGEPQRAPLFEEREPCLRGGSYPHRALVRGAGGAVWLIAANEPFTARTAFPVAPARAGESTLVALADGTTWLGDVTDDGAGNWTAFDVLRDQPWPEAALWLAGPGAVCVTSTLPNWLRRLGCRVEGETVDAYAAPVCLPETVLASCPLPSRNPSPELDEVELEDSVRFVVGSGTRLWAVAGLDPKLTFLHAAVLPAALGQGHRVPEGVAVWIWQTKEDVRGVIVSERLGTYAVVAATDRAIPCPIPEETWEAAADRAGARDGWEVAPVAEIKANSGRRSLARFRYVEVTSEIPAAVA